MTIFSLYFPLLLSLLSFLLHIIINSFKNHIHSFKGFATAIKTTNNNATDNHSKLHLKCHYPISSTATTHVNVSSPSSTVGLCDDIDGFMCCTESLGFESIDERRVGDHMDHDHEIHYNNNNNDENEDGDGCCSWRRMRVAEGRGNRREVKSFPPPLSSLNRNGQPSFFLLPVRKNGRLKLKKVRMNRPEILYASRDVGRLKLYLVPDKCIVDDVEEEEYEDEEEEEELVEEVAEQEEEEITVESAEEEKKDRLDEEIRDNYKKEEDRVGEWKFPNEGFRRCHQVMNQCYYVHGSQRHLHMYGVGIA